MRNEEALPVIEKSLELDPKNALALDTKGFILYNLGKFEESIKNYDKAIELDPENDDAGIW